MDYISKCILDYPNIETGGQLFGFWTTDETPVILYAIGPGPNAEHHLLHFIQDSSYLEHVGEILINKYGLQHIGEWHSHHQLGLAFPSGQDSNNMLQVIQQYGLQKFILCIGNCTKTTSSLNAFSFHIKNPRNYIQAKWDIKDIDSPFRALIDTELEDILIHPRQKNASLGNLFVVEHQNTTATPKYDNNYWLNVKGNNAILKDIIDYLTIYDGFKVNIQMDKQKIVHLFLNKPGTKKHIIFPDRFPYTSPIIETEKDHTDYLGLYFDETPVWDYYGDIYKSFINFYKQS